MEFISNATATAANGVQAIATATASSTETVQQNNKGICVKFPKGQAKQKFQEALKNSPLDDRVPTAKSLAKKGFTNVTGTIYGLGEWYEDKNGNLINVVGFKDNYGKLCKSVIYTEKDGSYQTVKFDPDGNALEGTIHRTPKAPGDPYETYKYDYDFEGDPILKDYHSENPSIHR